MHLRSTLLWAHLVVGIVMLPVIVILSGTGVLLAYQRQIVEWYDTHNYRTAPPSSDAVRLTPDQLLAAVRAERPDVSLTSVAVHADQEAPAEVGTAARRTIFVNPYTGRVLGESGDGPRSFFRVVSAWHTGLGRGRDSLGHAVAAASNLVLIFMAVVGLVLWWPRTLSWRAVLNGLWFRRRLSHKARDFNWHHVIGFWCALPLSIIAAGALPMSYPWASDLVFLAVGQTPEPRRGSAAGRNGGASAQQPGRGRGQRPGGSGRAGGDAGMSASEGRGRESGASGTRDDRGLERDTLRVTELWTRAEEPGWQTITARLPMNPQAPIEFTTDLGTSQQPQKRSVRSVDVRSGQVVGLVTFSDRSFGARIRTYLRFAHTGEVLGVVTQTVAAVSCLGACVMAYTGLALSWRRFNSRRTLRERRHRWNSAEDCGAQRHSHAAAGTDRRVRRTRLLHEGSRDQPS